MNQESVVTRVIINSVKHFLHFVSTSSCIIRPFSKTEVAILSDQVMLVGKENECVYGHIFLALKMSMSISSDSEKIFDII
jgi:hypothetical protein